MNSSLNRLVLQLHERITNRHILSCLEELNHTQWLSCEELTALQRTKLINLLEYANRYVPYYQRTFEQVGFTPDDIRSDLSAIKKIPILTKDLIRANYTDLLTTEIWHKKHLSTLSTSGSTGQPLVFLQDSNFRDAVTADIQRHLGWGGCKLGDKQALIWGAGLKPSFRQKARTRLIDWVWNRFQLNAFIMTEKNMTAFAKRVQNENPRVLFGYPTSIHRFAQFIRNNPSLCVTFDSIYTSAEMLLPPVRDYIEETFHCRVYNRYGTLELGGIACECESHDGYHISVENNYVELLRDGYECESGEVGNILVTNLNNLGMPFIRYEIGDAGAWQMVGNCPCGRGSPKLAKIEGRLVDSFQTQDGAKVWSGFAGAAYRCLTHPTIKQFQVIQKSLDRIVVRLIAEGNIPQLVLDDISHAIKSTFGEIVVVAFEFPDVIPSLPSGKHQYAMSELNKS